MTLQSDSKIEIQKQEIDELLSDVLCERQILSLSTEQAYEWCLTLTGAPLDHLINRLMAMGIGTTGRITR